MNEDFGRKGVRGHVPDAPKTKGAPSSALPTHLFYLTFNTLFYLRAGTARTGAAGKDVVNQIHCIRDRSHAFATSVHPRRFGLYHCRVEGSV